MKLYADGALVASNAGYTTSLGYLGFWRWGQLQVYSLFTGSPTAGSYFTGVLDEVAVYGVQLLDARIAAHYSANP